MTRRHRQASHSIWTTLSYLNTWRVHPSSGHRQWRRIFPLSLIPFRLEFRGDLGEQMIPIPAHVLLQTSHQLQREREYSAFQSAVTLLSSFTYTPVDEHKLRFSDKSLCILFPYSVTYRTVISMSVKLQNYWKNRFYDSCNFSLLQTHKSYAHLYGAFFIFWLIILVLNNLIVYKIERVLLNIFDIWTDFNSFDLKLIICHYLSLFLIKSFDCIDLRWKTV